MPRSASSSPRGGPRSPPQQAGLPDVGQRRVPGLRRGEVAALAGVSIEYYAKLERGALGGVSASVLDAIARALQLDDAERAHLFHLAHAADGTSAIMRPDAAAPQAAGPRGPACNGPSTPSPAARDHPQRPAWTCSPPTTSAGPCTPSSTTATRRRPELRPVHLPRRRAHRFYPDWDTAADICVAILRTEAGRDPHDKALHDLVGELSTRSDEFRRRWSCPQRPPPRRRHQTLPPPRRRRLDLAYESVDMIADPGLSLTIYAAEPASPTAHALDLLASWAATTAEADSPVAR